MPASAPETAASVLRTARELLRQPLGSAADAGYRRMVGRTGATVQCLPGLVRPACQAYLRVVVAAVHRRSATCGPYRSTQKRDNPAANASMLCSA